MSLDPHNEHLQSIVRADQADRLGQPTAEQWEGVARRDAERRSQVHEELRGGRVRSAYDFFNAALVMQHGSELEEIRLAHALATVSASMDSTSPQARQALWLKAASWDRMMRTLGRPQWYGTQFLRDKNGTVTLYTVDESAVTDPDRVALAAPTLAEARAQAEEMSRAK
jgi:hypothetical protein